MYKSMNEGTNLHVYICNYFFNAFYFTLFNKPILFLILFDVNVLKFTHW